MSSPGAPDPAATADIHHELGALTRQLHDSLTGLGLTEKVQNWAGQLPDAQSRLSYIVQLTGQAAEKVLTEVEYAKNEQAAIAQHMAQLQALGPADAAAMQQHQHAIAQANQRLDTHLTNIMLAQDFHDLTGQVIAKVVALAGTIEEQLLQLLLKTAPATGTTAPPSTSPTSGNGLAGPVIPGQNTSHVVTSQSEVDDLLNSLGF